MRDQDEHDRLLAAALAGDRTSQERLALIAQTRLHEFVYRLTLKEDLTRDIVQESLVEMASLFHKPKPVDRFWKWLYAIAYNKTCRQFQYERRHRAVSLSEIEQHEVADSKAVPAAHAVEQELRSAVVRCMQALEPKHRAILTLRCYDGMPYSEIAGLMGCTEFAARTLFCRAKRALAGRLAGCGLAKAGLVTALVVFGKVTASSPASAAQVAVSSTTLSAGTAASLAAVLLTKTAYIGMGTALVVGVGASMTNVLPGPHDGSATNRSGERPPASIRGVAQGAGSLYFFPEGTDGPVMMRLQATEGQPVHWAVLQTDQANFFCDGSRVELRNQRAVAPGLAPWTLPIDLKAASSPLTVPMNGPGTLVIVSGAGNQLRATRVRQPNALQEDYFQPNRDAGLTWTDLRDPMHKRGWAFFEIEGSLQGRPVSGAGLVAFVYAAYRQHRPWLRLDGPNGLHLTDLTDSATLQGPSGSTGLNGGDLLRGLSRPWMGLHTADLIRREAGRCGLQSSLDLDRRTDKASLRISQGETALCYTIDMDLDLIERIDLVQKDLPAGQLIFRYLQEDPSRASRFMPPVPASWSQRDPRPLSGPLWLMRLTEGSLGGHSAQDP